MAMAVTPLTSTAVSPPSVRNSLIAKGAHTPAQCCSGRPPVGRIGAPIGLPRWTLMRRNTGALQFETNQLSERRMAAMASLGETSLAERQWGPPISLGTVELPLDVDLPKLETLLFQWGTNLTQNANLPLPVPLKVDRVDGGVRLGYVKVADGKLVDVVHIDMLVFPPSDTDPKPMFRALRNGEFKNSVPAGEPLIMQSLLQALKKALALARTS